VPQIRYFADLYLNFAPRDGGAQELDVRLGNNAFLVQSNFDAFQVVSSCTQVTAAFS